MTYVRPPATKPPPDFPWTDPPDAMLRAMRKEGLNDTQSIALIRSIIWQTYELLQQGKRVKWQYLGRWEIHHYARTTFPQPMKYTTDPDTGDVVQETIDYPPMNRISFRPNWRRGLEL